jgi:hypothetical protein
MKRFNIGERAKRADNGRVVTIVRALDSATASLYSTEDFQDGHTAILEDVQLVPLDAAEQPDPAAARRYRDYLASFPLDDPRG